MGGEFYHGSVGYSFDRYMEWCERKRRDSSFNQPTPFRKLMEFAWRMPLLGSLGQGLCWGVLMFPPILLLVRALQPAWQACVLGAGFVALAIYPCNRWRHNRPERFERIKQ